MGIYQACQIFTSSRTDKASFAGIASITTTNKLITTMKDLKIYQGINLSTTNKRSNNNASQHHKKYKGWREKFNNQTAKCKMHSQGILQDLWTMNKCLQNSRMREMTISNFQHQRTMSIVTNSTNTTLTKQIAWKLRELQAFACFQRKHEHQKSISREIENQNNQRSMNSILIFSREVASQG